jgi:NAD(P)-dependent dehydrogenase (short-subunit alcohol dehydrogenase family)
LLAAKKIIPSM